MKILIVSATHKEILPLFNLLKLQHIPEISYYQGARYQNKNIDVLITGIGMVNTSYWTAKILHESTYDLAINIGIAGSYNYNLKKGDVVNVTRDSFPELGAEVGDSIDSIFDLGIMSENEKPFKEGSLNNPMVKFGIFDKLPKTKGITSNTIHGNQHTIDNIKEFFNPDIETMEGGAFMFCCLMDNTKFLQIRGISNYVEKRDPSKWKIDLAIANSNKILKEFLDDEKGI